jgi:uncharacterized protein YciI
MKTLLVLLASTLAAQTPAPPDLELYYLVFLRPDPDRRAIPAEEGRRIQSAHMANMQKMAKDGILIAAGPMADRPVTISGIFVFKAASPEEAKRIAAQDPTVVEHLNTVDVHPWHGPKDIGVAYRKYMAEHPGEKDKMTAYAFCIFFKEPGWTKEDPAHAAWIMRMLGEGRLTAAGYIEDDSKLAGICIFKTGSVEEAEKLVAENPSVKSGKFRIEFHKWFSAEGVMPW